VGNKRRNKIIKWLIQESFDRRSIAIIEEHRQSSKGPGAAGTTRAKKEAKGA